MGHWTKNHRGAIDSAAAFTLIRRVIATASGFHCGICRSFHESRAGATACLDLCWQQQLNAAPVVAIRKGQFTLYRCRFCKREFPDQDDASECAGQCGTSLGVAADEATTGTANLRDIRAYGSDQTKHIGHAHGGSELNQEQDSHRMQRRKTGVPTSPWVLTNGAIDPLVAKTMTKTVMMPFQVRNAINNQNSTKSIARAMLKLASGIAIGTRKLGHSKSHGGGIVSKDIDTSRQPGKLNSQGTSGSNFHGKKNPDKKFFRDGAKYVCAVCKAKFFTKLEVESCWDQH